MISGTARLQQTTDYKVVIPFFGYAAVALLFATLLLLLNTNVVTSSHINPVVLAITHIMTLGWGTMVIFGASYQLLPVLIEGKLYSCLLAYLTFVFSGAGIPVLIYGFFKMDFSTYLPIGAIVVNAGILCYLLNILLSTFKSSKRNVHAWFIIVASIWLFSTTIFGMLLVFNFNYSFFSENSWQYLEIHAHIGLVGWFLLLVIGVGSRLIPMFLISKYSNNKILWYSFALINLALLSFILIELLELNAPYYYFISVAFMATAIILFGCFVKKAYQSRIRRKVDEQVKTSILSIVQLVIPIVVLIFILTIFPVNEYRHLALLYGFTILFGWITAIIFGMTYKTLPFIVWNRVYDKKAYKGKTPAPKDLFNKKVYHIKLIVYLISFVLFMTGIVTLNDIVLKIGATGLFVAAVLYTYNTILILFHKIEKL